MNCYNKNLIYYLLPLLTLSFISFSVKAQEDLPAHSVQITGGYNLNSSNLLKGIVFGTEYNHYLNKNFSVNINYRGNINSREYPIMVKDFTGRTINDMSVRITTSGIQAGVNCQWSFIHNKRHELFVGAGMFVRYQSASQGSGGFSIIQPASSGNKELAIIFHDKKPQHTLSIGPTAYLGYKVTLNNQYFIGTNIGIQIDTNKDVYSHIVLAGGKRF